MSPHHFKSITYLSLKTVLLWTPEDKLVTAPPPLPSPFLRTLTLCQISPFSWQYLQYPPAIPSMVGPTRSARSYQYTIQRSAPGEKALVMLLLPPPCGCINVRRHMTRETPREELDVSSWVAWLTNNLSQWRQQRGFRENAEKQKFRAYAFHKLSSEQSKYWFSWQNFRCHAGQFLKHVYKK